jgi:hypothetical protein
MQPTGDHPVVSTVSLQRFVIELFTKDKRHMTGSNTSKLMLMALCLALACAAVPVVVLAG